jgi:CDP-diacylglycerol--serine O-phosphatidyltransferase
MSDVKNLPEAATTRKKRLRRKIVILPSIFTVANVFCGFYAIIASINGEFDNAAKSIGWAWVCDVLDGKIARLVHATSDFGLQLDSLADVISFCVAPMILLVLWGLQPVGPIGQLAAFIYLICGTMRLARFNIQTVNLKHFVGMPTPAGGTLIAALVHFSSDSVTDKSMAIALTFLAALLGFLMISTMRYPNFKSVSLTKGKSHFNILIIGIVIVAVYLYSYVVLLGLTSVYAFSGLLMKFLSPLRRKKALDSVSPSVTVEGRKW